MAKKVYPVLPVRGAVIYPQTVFPLAIGRKPSVDLIEDLVSGDDAEPYIVLVAQKDRNELRPDVSDLYKVGVLAKIVSIVRTSDAAAFQIMVKGVERVKLVDMVQEDPYFKAVIEGFPLERADNEYEEVAFKQLKQSALRVIGDSDESPMELHAHIEAVSDPDYLCDLLISNMEPEVEQRQEILESKTLLQKITATRDLIESKVQAVEVSKTIQEKIEQELTKTQKEYYLRQQMKAIKQELGEGDDLLDNLENRIDAMNWPDEVAKQARKQLDRLKVMQSSSSEYSVTLTYLETLLSLPWYTHSDDILDLDLSQEVLDNDHYGLDKVKDRVLEFLAVRTLRNDMRGPILCLSGPPGVGKSSLAKSIARSMGRKFVRVALGGVHDESEIRGHRRTYVGAMPGQIAKAMAKAGTNNPVILLDEIDKITSSQKGDPQAAMLEVLDPEQNDTFADHYVEVPLDLSNVLFIATANQLEGISGPLRDRMEVIEVPSYTSFEKLQIAKAHLVPKQVLEHGLTEDQITIQDEALNYLIDHYTREAGVRTLERRVAALCRGVAVQVAKMPVDEREGFQKDVDKAFVLDTLGPERFQSEIAERTSCPGVSTGLAWTAAGGDILFIEVSKMKGKGNLKFTGQLGDVMKESVEAALTYLRANYENFGLAEDFLEAIDLHVHFPAGAVPKDGPSAGITIFTAILSALTGIKVRHDVAMTGEITLRGKVLPVGGIKEKVTAAHRAGITEVIMPKICEKDLMDVNEEIKRDVTFHFVSDVSTIPTLALESALPIIPVKFDLGVEISESEAN